MNTLVSSDDGRIMRLINKLAYCLAATIPVAILAGCSGASSSGGGGPLESSTIVIDAVPTADAAGLYIAYDDGFFAKQGLTVKIAPINGGEYGMGDLQTGKAQLVEGNYVSFVLAQVAGKFAAPDPNESHRAPPAGQADRHAHHRRLVADAAGQPGAVRDAGLPLQDGGAGGQGPRDGRRQLAAQHRLGAARLAARRERVQAELGYPDAGDSSGDADCCSPSTSIETAWLPEPFGTEAQEEYGAVEIADFDQGSLQNFPIGTIVGSAQWVKTHPNTIAAFLRAYDQGQQIADTDRSAVEKALVLNTGVSQLIAANMTLDTYPLAMDVPVMQRVPDAMYQFGVLSAALQHHGHDPARAR